MISEIVGANSFFHYFFDKNIELFVIILCYQSIERK
jgi:hypothetical protein